MNPDVSDITPLDPEQRERTLDAIADRIHRYRMETPALLLLEASRPLAGLAGMASFVVTPLFGAFMGLNRAESYAALLGDRDAFDELLLRLERGREAPAAPAAEPLTNASEAES